MAIPRPRSFSISFPESPRRRLRSFVASADPPTGGPEFALVAVTVQGQRRGAVPPEVGLDLFDQPPHLPNQRLDLDP